ncbi:uncharacterized protein HKW66_Vig0000950 [Vigna angularis]|uniref:Uncharacterized protein n=1 Tax=Phaseolus angularis TaxID=3914 RepID=A0A8T0L9D2_PHAAN|nr:uncharacterized protein HKW66_Vig0000950 [Vigna angularis]
MVCMVLVVSTSVFFNYNPKILGKHLEHCIETALQIRISVVLTVKILFVERPGASNGGALAVLDYTGLEAEASYGSILHRTAFMTANVLASPQSKMKRSNTRKMVMTALKCIFMGDFLSVYPAVETESGRLVTFLDPLGTEIVLDREQAQVDNIVKKLG